MKLYRVLVTGSRDWRWYFTLTGEVRDRVWGHEHDLIIVHGACPTGADAMIEAWAQARDIPTERHPARWKTLGSRAGLVRNEQMVNLGADLCLAFIRNNSPGASHCAGIAQDAGIPTVRIRDNLSGTCRER